LYLTRYYTRQVDSGLLKDEIVTAVLLTVELYIVRIFLQVHK